MTGSPTRTGRRSATSFVRWSSASRSLLIGFGSSSGLTRARQRHPNRAEVCHIVQHVVILHRMWADSSEFRWRREEAVAAGAEKEPRSHGFASRRTMSRGDEVRTTAHNVLHAALGSKSVRHKDCSVRTFAPHREVAYADLEEKHDPRGGRRYRTGLLYRYQAMRQKSRRVQVDKR